jgi:hypothetical protein
MTLLVHHRRLGMVDSVISKLDSAVNEYDEKLIIDRHPTSGQWAVYIKLERPNPPYPLFVISGPLPTSQQLIERLQKMDSFKRDIRAEMNRANAQREAEIDYKTKQEVGKAAEMVHAIAKKQGMAEDNQSRRKIIKE